MKKYLTAACLTVALAAAFVSTPVIAQQPRPGNWAPGQPTCGEWFEAQRQTAVHDLGACIAGSTSNTMQLGQCAANFSATMSYLIGGNTACILGLR